MCCTVLVLLLFSLQSSPCYGLTNQRWWKDADGALRPWHALDYCLDVTLGNISPGTRLQVGSTAQCAACIATAVHAWRWQGALQPSATCEKLFFCGWLLCRMHPMVACHACRSVQTHPHDGTDAFSCECCVPTRLAIRSPPHSRTATQTKVHDLETPRLHMSCHVLH